MRPAASAARHPLLGLAVLFAAAFTTITTETLPSGLLPLMSRALQVPESLVGLLVGAYALLILAVTVPLVALTSRWSRRRLLIVLMGAFAAGNLLTALAPNYSVAMAARLVAGLGHGVLWSMMAAYAASLVAPHRTGRAIAGVFAANSAALTLGVPLGTALGQVAGWRVPFAILAGLAALVAAVARVALPDMPGTAKARPSSIRAVRLPDVRTVMVTTGLVMLGHFTLATYIAPFLLGAGIAQTGLSTALLAFGLAGVLGVIAAGAAVDRAPRGALLTALGAMTLAVAALVLLRGNAAVAAAAVWGAAYAALPPLLQALILKAAPGAQAAASALFIITFNISITAGSLLGGQLLAWHGPTALPFAAAILTAAAVLPAARRITLTATRASLG
ncbi:MFS transporter [Micromonospora sp. KC721]|uniref:MFS transporter n=1 Tax=Micromonospora sp. KC721 TaxID=2530380 RepID=UPI00104A0618|nr:MFS transporter [Micromonospora sp. KC721]TDB79091.1 MFS transporter [Micromonospora sp. KC721]